MYFEFAVDPKAVSNARDQDRLRLFIDNFGFDHGRLISRFPKNWVREVLDNIVDVNERKVILEKIKNWLKTKHPIIETNRKFNLDMADWLANAIEQHNENPFRAIITEKVPDELPEIPELLCCSEIDGETPYFKVDSEKDIIATGENIACEMKLLLNAASKVLFVDPNFDLCDPKYKETLSACVNKMQQCSQRVIHCEIHYKYQEAKGNRNERSSENIENLYEKDDIFKDYINSILSDGIILYFFCWDKKENGRHMHDRYLLTDIGGLRSNHGFQAFGADSILNFSFLSWDKNIKRQKFYDRKSKTYDLIGPVICFDPIERLNIL